MTSTEIIQHLRRGIDHGITITPAEAEGLVKLVEGLQDKLTHLEAASTLYYQKSQREIERLKAEKAEK